MSLRKVALGIIVGMVLVVTFVMMTGNAAAADAPVTIDGDAAMTTYASVHSLTGDGTSINPYIIQGLVIDANNGVNGIVIANVNLYVLIQNCEVSNTQNVNNNIGNGDGIFITSSSHIQVCNNLIFDTLNGITINGCQLSVIHGNTVRNVTSSGIKVASCTSVEVCHNFCADSVNGITMLISSHGCKIDNNTCLRGSYGYYIAGSYQNVLSDNYAKGYVYGISIELGSIMNQINLNNCSSNSYSGIFLMEDNNAASRNRAYNNGYSGMQVNDADYCVLTNNTCIANARGIHTTGANHVTLNDNNCSRNTQYGFSANGCQNVTTNRNQIFHNLGIGVYLNQCRNSYMWYDVVRQSTGNGFFVSGSSWIYTTATSSFNGANGFYFTTSNNCTVGSGNASSNVQNGVDFENCHLCRVIDGSFMSNVIGINMADSDLSTVQRVRAYLNTEGVEFYESDRGSISDCLLDGNHYGIWISSSSQALVANNDIFDSSQAGIIVLGADGSDNCTISTNTISSLIGTGIQISSAKDLLVQANQVSNCNRDIMIASSSRVTVHGNEVDGGDDGLYIRESDHCAVTSNLFNALDDHGILGENSRNLTLDANIFHGGVYDIYIETCHDCTVVRNQCDASLMGIYNGRSTGTVISDGRCIDTTGGTDSVGVFDSDSTGTIVQNMNLTQCNIGLEIEYSVSSIVVNNTLLLNRGVGAYLFGTTGNLLHDNRFIFNHGSNGIFDIGHYQAYDDTEGNLWNTSGPNGSGNFWSDWCYPDIDRDGIVDSSFFIVGGAYDHFPLAETSDPVVMITSPGVDGVVFTTNGVTLSWDATDTWSGLDHYEVIMDVGPWLEVGIGNIQNWQSLSDGQHHLYVKAVDKAGNEAEAVRLFYIDANAPEAAISFPGNHTAVNDNTPSFSWTGTDAGSGIVYYNVSWDTGAYIPIGSVGSYTIPSSLADGTHTFYLRATDNNGHVRVYYVEIYIDTMVPSLDSVYPSEGSTVTVQDVQIMWYAFDLAISPSGLDRTEVRMDASGWANAGLASSCTFNDVPEGFHTIYLRTFDKAGNSVEKQARFMVDYVQPSINILSPANHTIYNVNEVTVTWTGSDLGSGIDHYDAGIDSGQMTFQGTGTSVTFSGLFDGSHNINVMAVDKSGKVRVAYVNIIVDTMAPTLSMITPSEGGFYSAAGINVTWNSMEFGIGIAYNEVKVDNGQWQSRGTSSYAQVQMSEGRHTIYVRSTDLAGNNRSIAVNITNDLNPPTIRSLTPADGSLVNSSNVSFLWNATDAIQITSIMYSIDSDSGHGLMTGTSSVSVTMSPGNHKFKLTVTDRAGRETSAFVNLTVDYAAPGVVSHTPSTTHAGASEKISFRFSETVDRAGMTVLVNGQESTFALKGTTYEAGTALVAGTNYTVRIAGARDAAGNIMEPFTWTFNVVSGEQSPGRFVLSGTMVDKSGQPVSGAMVTIGGQSLSTNVQGQFSVYVDPGQQNLQVTSSGMAEFAQSVMVNSDKEMGKLAMTSLADSTGNNGQGTAGGDMMPYLILGLVGAIGALVLVFVIVKKRRSRT